MDKEKPFSMQSMRWKEKYFSAAAQLYGRRPDNERKEIQLEFQLESTGAEGKPRANSSGELVNHK
jgi:hypothetical protein